ncbi:hypothetical protein HDU93_000535 [Gonapodya sp. JEL0774]|nr:hypothetical protein HDU93_000535 [Gonapodya sp. JEL0774]
MTRKRPRPESPPPVQSGFVSWSLQPPAPPVDLYSHHSPPKAVFRYPTPIAGSDEMDVDDMDVANEGEVGSPVSGMAGVASARGTEGKANAELGEQTGGAVISSSVSMPHKRIRIDVGDGFDRSSGAWRTEGDLGNNRRDENGWYRGSSSISGLSEGFLPPNWSHSIREDRSLPPISPSDPPVSRNTQTDHRHPSPFLPPKHTSHLQSASDSVQLPLSVSLPPTPVSPDRLRSVPTNTPHRHGPSSFKISLRTSPASSSNLPIWSPYGPPPVATVATPSISPTLGSTLVPWHHRHASASAGASVYSSTSPRFQPPVPPPSSLTDPEESSNHSPYERINTVLGTANAERARREREGSLSGGAGTVDGRARRNGIRHAAGVRELPAFGPEREQENSRTEGDLPNNDSEQHERGSRSAPVIYPRWAAPEVGKPVMAGLVSIVGGVAGHGRGAGRCLGKGWSGGRSGGSSSGMSGVEND